MTKNVFVQNNLYELKEELKKRGYNIVDKEDTNYDVFVYEADGYDINYYNQISSSENNINSILLINAKGKDIKEIDYMITHKSYSPLF
ncbi:YkuS family protein [Clostridiaceae bacterium M8S5]|nr:YkuS family protein [Clostridiaceae bacterium M8S5]